MNQAVLVLAACYALLAALLVAALVYSRWPAWLKLVLVVLVSGTYYLSYAGLERLLGWPTVERIPERFLLLASSVREPDRASGDPGVIHLWVNALAGARPAQEPRAYELPYSRELHYALQEARKRQGEGIPQMGRRIYAPPAEDVLRDRTRFATSRETVHIENLPDPVLPEK